MLYAHIYFHLAITPIALANLYLFLDIWFCCSFHRLITLKILILPLLIGVILYVHCSRFSIFLKIYRDGDLKNNLQVYYIVSNIFMYII